MIAAITVLFLCSLLGFRYYLIFKNESLFANKAQDKIQFFEQLLHYEQITLEMFTYDEQVQDTVRSYFATRNDIGLYTQLDDFMPSFGINAIWLYSADHSLLYHQCPLHKMKTKDCGLDKDTLTRLFQRGSYYRHFFMMTPAGFVEIRTAPVATSDEDKAAYATRAVLLAGRLWSSEHLERFAKKAGAVEVQILPISQGSDLKPDYTPATGRITFSKVLLDWRRRPIRRVFAAYETPIISEFNKSSNIQLAALLVFALAIVAMLTFCFMRWMIAPLKSISEALETNNPAPVKAITAQQTEFGRIGRIIQQFFQQQEVLVAEIDERRRTEESLRISEQNYRTVFESTGTAMIIFDEDMIISMANSEAERLSGYSKAEIEGKMRWTDFVVSDDLARMKEYHKMRGHDSAAVPQSYDFRIIDKAGNMKNIFQTVSLIPGTSKRIISLIDITESKKTEAEKKKLEAQLQRAETMETIGTLAGGVAHDLNNILGAIVGYPDLLLDEIPGESPMRRSIIAIKESGERAAAIVQDLLTLARRGINISEVVNLDTVVKRYLDSSEYRKLKEFYPNIRIEASHCPNLLNIFGSPVHLSKTIMNLVANAAESIPEYGSVMITTENIYLDKPLQGYDAIEEGDYCSLTVADSGSGIPEADLSRIFEPFYTKKVMGRSGTGLGLAVVWGTVKDHKGYIDIESEEGKGSTFKLYFPVTRMQVESIDSSNIEEYTGNREKILVIDDIEAQREISTTLLRKLNYIVATVSSGEEAVEYLKDNSADLLILDMIMNPGMDGLETYKKIIETHPGQKALIVSGFSETDRIREAQKLGAGKYIKKPYTIETIGLEVKAELHKCT